MRTVGAGAALLPLLESDPADAAACAGSGIKRLFILVWPWGMLSGVTDWATKGDAPDAWTLPTFMASLAPHQKDLLPLRPASCPEPRKGGSCFPRRSAGRCRPWPRIALLPPLAGGVTGHSVSSLLMGNRIMTDEIARRGVRVSSACAAQEHATPSFRCAGVKEFARRPLCSGAIDVGTSGGMVADRRGGSLVLG